MMIYNQFRQNLYVIVGLFLGLFFGTFFIPEKKIECPAAAAVEEPTTSLWSKDFVPKVNLAEKPLKAQKNPKKLLRPRYFSTELGIREKLLVAVLTTQETIFENAVALNKTVSRYADKLLFFIDAPGSQKLNVSYAKLPGIVGFIDTRLILKPFHVLKYIKDNYLENYDFFFVSKDGAYIKTGKLNDIVRKISISQHVYASSKVTDSLYCSLGTNKREGFAKNAGILFSNSVLRQMLKNIDWCVKNVFSSSDDDNFGRCVLHSSDIPCQQLVQGNRFSSYKLENESQLKEALKSSEMEQALTVFPLKKAESFYALHAYFSKVTLEATKLEISSLRSSVKNTTKMCPEGYQSVSWPVGNEPGNKPVSRFDVLRWDYFTEDVIYLADDFTNVRPLKEAERLDVEIILKAATDYIHARYDGKFRYRTMANGYRKFDPSRGMDYKLDLTFQDVATGKIVDKRLEICKPLGKAEMLTVPYVTENKRVNILLPVTKKDKEEVETFLRSYRTTFLEKKDKTFLMLVFLYEYDAPGKGTKDDVFKDLKDEALSLTKIFQRDDNRVAWLSIKLPPDGGVEAEGLLDFIAADLALKKFPSESLVLMTRPNAALKSDYLNRVRMNTILNWQIFSAIPFARYNPIFVPKTQSASDVNKHKGRYDDYDTRHISFYAKDYANARRKIESVLPAIKTDSDVKRFFTNLNYATQGENLRAFRTYSIYSMFVRFGDVHVIRSAEPDLHSRYVEKNCERTSGKLYDNDTFQIASYERCISERNANLGSRSQLSRIILEYNKMHSRTN